MRIERIALKDHGDIAILWRDLGHIATIDLDAARGHRFQAGDHAQGGGLATTRRAQQHHEFPGVNRQAEFMQDGQLSE